MLYLLHYLKDDFQIFNIFRYITFRAASASVTAFLLTLWLGPKIIRWLKSLNVTQNQKREHAESIHAFYAHKEKVPTMGGVMIVLSVVVSTLIWANLSNSFVWLLLTSVAGYGAVGFLDDWTKLRGKNSKGISSRAKMLGQVLFAVIIGFFLYMEADFDKWLYFPLVKTGAVYLGIFFIPFVILVLTGTSNALNLTDGLDGLAIGCTLFTVGSLGVVSYLAGRVDFSAYLSIPYIPQAGEVTVFAAALFGASAGFMWFNCYPAEVMMGDTGSLALGAAIGTMAVLIKKEILLVVVGGVFVLEAVSVMMQVASFKMFKKRIFLMSPFHHHLQLKGWPESKVTIRLWMVAMVLAIVGLSILKVR